jgi:hypothetical protein
MQLKDMQIHQTSDVISVIVMHTCRWKQVAVNCAKGGILWTAKAEKLQGLEESEDHVLSKLVFFTNLMFLLLMIFCDVAEAVIIHRKI